MDKLIEDKYEAHKAEVKVRMAFDLKKASV